MSAKPSINPSAIKTSSIKPIRSALLPETFAELRGRGARSNRESRFLHAPHEADPEFLESERNACGDAPAGIRTSVVHEQARTIISRNQSPDVPFDRSINPYRGCEHGCVYCYARPSHAYLGLSPGLDFETRLFAKDNAAQLLERELRRPGYRAQLLALGANTDPYQPIERDLRITRSVLEVLAAFGHPVGITTKSAAVLRDLDLLRSMARDNLVHVWISIATLDRDIARSMEPRASTPARRIQTLRELAGAGVSCGVIVGPVIPALTEEHLEAVLAETAAAGSRHASYVTLRLPLELRELFTEWLQDFAPMRAAHVLSRLHQMGADGSQTSAFGTRMRGKGIFADLTRRRFELACLRLGLERSGPALDCSRFRVPQEPGAQQRLF